MDNTQVIALIVLFLYFAGFIIFKIIEYRNNRYTKRVSINIDSDSMWVIGKTLELLGKKFKEEYRKETIEQGVCEVGAEND